MTKVKVRLVQLGTPPVSLKKLSGWKSEFFEIVGIHHVPELPNSDLDDPPWAYSNDLLRGLMDEGEEADIKVGVINVPLEQDFFMHRLSAHTCVLTLHDMAGYMTSANIPLETFVIRNVYEMVLLYFEFNGSVNSDAYRLPHEDTRGCLYDFCAYKPNAVWSTVRVNLCISCKSRLMKKQLPHGFIDKLERELGRIKKPVIVRAIEFVKTQTGGQTHYPLNPLAEFEPNDLRLIHAVRHSPKGSPHGCCRTSSRRLARSLFDFVGGDGKL